MSSIFHPRLNIDKLHVSMEEENKTLNKFQNLTKFQQSGEYHEQIRF